ncbi:MAG: glycoside hydrolase family 3 C-terminal domain-containing protein [Bacteroidales bacterium]|nr:glycoside hydrolase family 3 C-terminal domain-containing protein [Bacteroidales bacterium]
MKIVFTFVLFSLAQLGLGQKYTYQDTALPLNQRVNQLISNLTLEEKAALMIHNSPEIERLDISEYNWWNECLHGVGRAGRATVFPQAIAMAATFDDSLLFRIGNAISDEARAKHNAALKKGNRNQYTGLSFWSPNINIFRDPRWGRGQETYGEDPYLTSQLGVAFVNGLQGNHPRYLKTSACAKHFVVHSGPEISRHHYNALPNERDFRETYLPAFKALVDAGVESVMCAYNRTNDEPCCASKWLLTDILRDEWGFEGHIVSDCWALDDMWLRHKVVDDQVAAAVKSLNAGTNLNCGYIYKYLPEAVEKGLIQEAEIDAMLFYTLKSRFKLGLFDPYSANPYNDIPAEVVNCPKHQELAWEAAVKSIVLLKNKNNILPLNKSKTNSLYITGPTAADITSLIGNYNGYSGNFVTILEGIINKVDEGTNVTYNMGSLLNTDSIFNGFWNASQADATVAVIGINRLLEGEDGDAMLNTNGGDRTNIGLPANQIEFIRKLKESSGEKPLIVVITGGSAIAIPQISEWADAILYAWYPGEQGGNAVADLLFGNQNPSGRLPVTFYNSTDELPAFDDYSMEGRTYRFYKGKALFPFGFGLSYTDFEYTNLQLNNCTFNEPDSIKMNFTLSNTGDFDGEEVVQIYIRKMESAYSTSNKSLKNYQRVYIEKGRNKNIQMKIPIQTLEYWNIENQKYEIEKGRYEIQISASSEDIRLKTTFTIK